MEAGDEEGLRNFYMRMHYLNARQVNLLASRGRLLEVGAAYPPLSELALA